MELPSKHRVFQNAKWTDHLGNIVEKCPLEFVSKGAPGRMGQLGVLKLGIAEEAFSRSFRANHPDQYKDIDHLFRCRNKIAHRGELSYRDDSGVTQPVDYNTVESGWNSIMSLIEWIETK